MLRKDTATARIRLTATASAMIFSGMHPFGDFSGMEKRRQQRLAHIHKEHLLQAHAQDQADTAQWF